VFVKDGLDFQVLKPHHFHTAGTAL
jgi:hypothetical protein